MKLFSSGQIQKLPTDTLMALLPRLQEKKARSFTTLVLTLSATAVFSLFAISPTLSTIADLHKQLDDSTFVEEQLGNKIAALTALQQKYTEITPDLPAILTAIPATASIPTFVAKIQAIGDTTGITIVHMQSFPVDVSSASVAGNGYTSFAFSIDCIGTKKQVQDFLTQLATSDRLITIDGVAIVKAAQAGDAQRLSVNGKAYFKPTL